MSDGQRHVVGAQWVGDVDDDLACQVTQALQGFDGVFVCGCNNNDIAVTQCLGRLIRTDIVKLISQCFGLVGVATRDPNGMADTGQLFGERRTHVAGTHYCNFHRDLTCVDVRFDGLSL
jgi:hypothetical protein